MIKGCLQGIRRKTVLIIIILIAVALVVGLNSYGYSIDPFSDYGNVWRGSPFPILMSDSYIYVGHNGRFAQEVGVKYILEATGKEVEFEFFFPGFIVDLLFYGVIGSFIIVLDAHKDSLIDKVKNTFENRGVLMGVIKILYLGLLGAVALFSVLIILVGLFFFILVTLGIRW